VTEPSFDTDELAARCRVAPGRKISLEHDFDPAATDGFPDKRAAKEALAAGIDLLADYQARLAAQDRRGVVVVLQALDAAGKDGVVKHVMSGLNPQGVRVESFKVPSLEELDHDYLWRYHGALPRRGQIGIFNRSHYEEVLVVRVHRELLERQHLPAEDEATHRIWDRRFREINGWERYLSDNGFTLVKIFLNLSRDEQRKRLLARIDTPEKNWKFSHADVEERGYWDDYQRAYEDVINHTSTEWAPWHVVPADHKWFSRVAVAAILGGTLVRLDPRYPELSPAQLAELERARTVLETDG
jgi:PPK2 family polyphosphate:nucleotide phosphotransferase